MTRLDDQPPTLNYEAPVHRPTRTWSQVVVLILCAAFLLVPILVLAFAMIQQLFNDGYFSRDYIRP